MQYSIEGRNCELLRVALNDGEGVLVEVGKLIFMREEVTWNVVLPGHGFAGIKRKIGGASVVLTEYAGPGEVGFSGDEPGTIRAVELAAGEEMVVRRGGFLAAAPSVTLSVAVVKRLRAGLLAGHTLILQRVTGPGTLFVHAAGDFAAFTLGQGEVLRADTDSVVWFDASVSYSAAWAGGVKRAFLGGEGLFLSTFTGSGRVTRQTMGHAPASPFVGLYQLAEVHTSNDLVE